MAEHVGPLDAQVVEQGYRVVGHLLDGVDARSVRRAATAAGIEDDHLQRLGERGHLIGQPDVAAETGGRDEDERLARAVYLVVEVDTGREGLYWHGVRSPF